MVRVTFMLHLLLLVLSLKQSDAVNEECRELQKKISVLEENITRITEQQHEYEQFFGQCKLSMYIQRHEVWKTYSNNSRPEIQNRTSGPRILCRWLLYCSCVVTVIQLYVGHCYVSG